MQPRLFVHLLVSLGVVAACSATGSGTPGSGLRGQDAATGGVGASSGGKGNGVGGVGVGTTGGVTPVSTAGGTGGKTGTGGGGTGGANGTGGAVGTSAGGGTGGANVGLTGGVSNSGGATSSGGMVGVTGGSSNTGGSVGAGGAGGTPSAGGATSTGGAPATGGSGGGMVTNGLIAHWKFDEQGGDSAADTSGNNHTLTRAGCATLGMAGNVLNALTLPNPNDCNGVASSTFSLGTSNELTVVLWINSSISSYPGGAGLIEFADVFSLSINSMGGLTWVNGDDTTAAAPASGAWHQVAVTVDSAGSLEIYVDGVVGPAGSGGTGLVGSHLLTVGQVAGGTDGFSGGIDDVRIYNRLLTTQELTTLRQ